MSWYALVGRLILYNWPVIGWHTGVLQRRVTDGRIKRDNVTCNFYVYYEIDDDEVPTALCLANYRLHDDKGDGGDEGGWMLLEAMAEGVGA